jgi:hypothetical protein
MMTIDDLSDPNNSCYGFHGSAHLEDTYYFACSHVKEEHGGILILEYNKVFQNISTRHIMYPTHPDLPNHRAGGIAAHDASPYIVTDFADWDAEVYAPQMLAFEATATEASADGVLTLGPLGQCEYAFEQANGKYVVVLLPDVSVQVYQPGPTWTKLAEVKISEEPWDECPWPAPFTVGYMRAFVAINETLHVLDLEHAEHGEIGHSTLDLGFIPHHMTVAGVPKGYECHGEHHDHDHPVEDSTDSPDSTISKNSDSEAKNAASAGVTQKLDLCVSALAMCVMAFLL